MKNKIIAILLVGILIAILGISIVRIFQSFFTIYIYFDYVIWCGNKEENYISYRVDNNFGFSLACCKLTFRREYQSITLISGFPSIFSKEQIIEEDDYGVSEYIKERDNKLKAMIICCLPYMILIIISTFIYKKKLLPVLTEN